MGDATADANANRASSKSIQQHGPGLPTVAGPCSPSVKPMAIPTTATHSTAQLPAKQHSLRQIRRLLAIQPAIRVATVRTPALRNNAQSPPVANGRRCPSTVRSDRCRGAAVLLWPREPLPKRGANSSCTPAQRCCTPGEAAICAQPHAGDEACK